MLVFSPFVHEIVRLNLTCVKAIYEEKELYISLQNHVFCSGFIDQAEIHNSFLDFHNSCLEIHNSFLETCKSLLGLAEC